MHSKQHILDLSILFICVALQVFTETGGNEGAQNGVVPMQHAIQEAAICIGMAHPNIVSTYHYVIVPLQTVGEDGGSGAEAGGSGGSKNGLQVGRLTACQC
jgi:hypothetical protein